jgi:phage gp45-like
MIRVVFTKVEDGKVRTFSATGRTGETFDAREFMQHFGLASLPKDGAVGVVVYNGNHIIAVASDDSRYRPELKAGESVLYDAYGHKIHLNKDGIDVTADKINLGGSRDELNALIDERFLQLFNQHTHAGVMAGNSMTAPPATPIIANQACTTKVKAG